MTMNGVDKVYLSYLSSLVNNRYKEKYYTQLFEHLYRREFLWTVMTDEDRSGDGLYLRRCWYDREAAGLHLSPYEEDIFLTSSCSMLEMLVALADRIEGSIMSNELYGDRTGLWFWTMIRNMGLVKEDDGRYDEEWVDHCIDRVLERGFEPDGTGGLFYIHGTDRDLRKASIWYQAMWYLATLDECQL